MDGRVGPALLLLLDNLLLQPQSATRTVEKVTYLTHRGAREEFDGGKEILDEMFQFWDQINTEDIEVVEKVQCGTAAPAYNGGRFSFRFEEPVHRFQNMVIDKMVETSSKRMEDDRNVGCCHQELHEWV